MRKQAFILLLILLLSAASTQATGETLTLPPDLGLNVTAPEFGATPNDATDDTAAIQKALDLNRSNPDTEYYYGRPKQLYFPPGTYLISNTLKWNGCCMGLQGAGSGQTTIKLIDNAPGFSDENVPKAMIFTPDGNMSFRQNIFDLTFDTGNGNPGAVGLDYISNNSGALRSLVIKSGDGQGKIGLDMTRAWPGPSLIRDVKISGFEVGIDIDHAEYGPTFEDITLNNLSVAGVRNTGNTLVFRNLKTNLTVPAIISTKDYSSLIVLDSSFSGGTGAYSAIETVGDVFVRNLTTSGYQSALKVKGAVVPGSAHTEYVGDNVYTLGPTGKTTSLSLPIKNIPAFHDNNLANWAKFDTPNAASAGHNLSALNTALNAGKSTVYFAGGATLWGGSTTVPAGVKRIIAFGHVINNYDGTSLTLRIEEASTTPLIIEGFGYGLKIEHKANRPLVIKHGNYTYKDFPGAGELYLDDVELRPVVFKYTPGVWARQLNTEGSGDTPRIINDGTKLWIMGIKTEGNSTIIETKNGGQTEVFGTLFYPATAVPVGRPALINHESDMSAIVSFSNYEANGFFTNWVRETRHGVTRELAVSSVSGRTLPLYVGTRPALPPNQFLINGSFEEMGTTGGQAAAWTIKAPTGSKRKCNKDGKPPVAHSNECAFQIKAITGANSKVTQKVLNPQLEVGITLTLSAFVEGKNLSGARVQANVIYTDGTKAKILLPAADLNAGTYAYKLLSGNTAITQSVSQIKVQVRVKNGTGRLRIDTMALSTPSSFSGTEGLLPLP